MVAYFYPARPAHLPDPNRSVVCTEDELPVGEARTIPFGRYPAIVVNTDGLKAYSAACTHFACTVKWNKERDRFECPCHDGYFKVEDGSVIRDLRPSRCSRSRPRSSTARSTSR